MKKFLQPDIELFELNADDIICTSVTVMIPDVDDNDTPDGTEGY